MQAHLPYVTLLENANDYCPAGLALLAQYSTKVRFLVHCDGNSASVLATGGVRCHASDTAPPPPLQSPMWVKYSSSGLIYTVWGQNEEEGGGAAVYRREGGEEAFIFFYATDD